MARYDDEKNNKNNDSNEEKEADANHTRSAKSIGFAAEGSEGGSLLGDLLSGQMSTKPETPASKGESPKKKFKKSRQFFDSDDDFAVLDAAAERIYPEDDNGPGASRKGVAYYIDRQLAGSRGMEPVNDWQMKRLNPDASSGSEEWTTREIFLEGLRKMNQLSHNHFDVPFDEANEAQQIDILKDFERDEVTMKGALASDFFERLRSLTMEKINPN